MSDAYIYEPNFEDWLEFSDGVITTFMSDQAMMTVPEDHTRKIYEAMKEYYDENK